MNKVIRGLSRALTVGLCAAAFSTAGNAASFTVSDTVDPNGPPVYFGGEVSGNNTKWEEREVVGDYDAFAIHSADVERIADDPDGISNDLSFRIFTNFAGLGNTSAAVNMEYGALFIGSDSSGIDFNTDDTFAADPGRFDYAVDMNYTLAGLAVGGSASGTSTVWNLDGSGNDVEQTDAGGTFREQQAWKPYTDPDNLAPDNGVSKNATASTTMTGTWEVFRGNNGTAGVRNTPGEEDTAHAIGDQTGLDKGTGYIDFVIKDFFAVGNPGATNTELVFAWGMQCANDVILGVIPMSGLAPPVPIPASFVLLLSGLLGLGWLGRSRAKQA